MIRSVSFTNFQGLTTPEPLPLSKFTVLIGLNGSGKTAVLRALWFVLSARDVGCVRRRSVPPNPEWIIEVRGTGYVAAVYMYDVHFASAALFSKCGEFKTPMPVKVDDESVRIIVREWEENPGKMWPKMENLLKEGVVLPLVATPEVVAAFHRGMNVEPWLLSRGVLQAIAAKQLLSEHPDAGVVLWDDLGSSMHPALVQHVVRWLNGLEDVQVIASTHSIDVLDELAMGDYDFTVLRLSRDGEKVIAEQLSADEVDRYFEGGIDPRKVFGGGGASDG